MIIANGCHIINNKEGVCPMIYAGIDIAKLNHFASVLSSDGKVLVEPFKFTNDNDGFCKLLAVLNKYDKSSLIIGLESTAHYGNNLVEFLVNRQFQVAVINPIQTSSMPYFSQPAPSDWHSWHNPPRFYTSFSSSLLLP